ncbi:alpha/beta hydrolase [Gluconobacter sp. P1D12_c]|uniref:alpha/beta hydrolase n=1 Tax=Gluconobacter sp. P1D12_c TaxID=2762614 RepID=UPI001C05851D|nr:alpha/beta fold hydrolase [Gluconobacter sp. P1D12_c]
MTNLLTKNLFIPSDTADIWLHLRHKRRSDIQIFGSQRTILLMHGATLPSESLFDVPVGEGAFMDILAQEGFDVYALNVRGFGGSTRPAGMEGTPEDAPPQVRTETAIRDLTTAVDYLLGTLALPRLCLIGMSWGGTITGAYTATHNDKVENLTLIAPQWINDGVSRLDPGGPIHAYRRFDVQTFRQRWLEGAPEQKREEILPVGWFEQWAAVILASDPAEHEGVIRAPAGVIQDIRDYWSTGKSLYNPEEVTVPVLLLHAEWDLDVTIQQMGNLFQRFLNAPYRRWTEIGEGTHMVIMEKNRWQVLEAILLFLRTDNHSSK